MPPLAKQFHVVSVDMRGMGLSSKPDDGYDTKTMAKDIYALVRHLGYDKVDIAGHDTGAAVAFAYAALYPQATRKLAIMDVPHPDETWMQIPMLPAAGKFGTKIDDWRPGYVWWFAFQQVKGLPECLLEGRIDIYINFCLDYLTKDSSSIDELDRRVYVSEYSVRASDAWFQAVPQDALDVKQFPKLEMPVLGLGSIGYDWLKASLAPKATHARIGKIEKQLPFLPRGAASCDRERTGRVLQRTMNLARLWPKHSVSSHPISVRAHQQTAYPSVRQQTDPRLNGSASAAFALWKRRPASALNADPSVKMPTIASRHVEPARARCVLRARR